LEAPRRAQTHRLPPHHQRNHRHMRRAGTDGQKMQLKTTSKRVKMWKENCESVVEVVVEVEVCVSPVCHSGAGTCECVMNCVFVMWRDRGPGGRRGSVVWKSV
jgi:hypothetical protein